MTNRRRPDWLRTAGVRVYGGAMRSAALCCLALLAACGPSEPDRVRARADTAAYLERWDELNSLVHDIVHRFGGSISAEHGIGRMKREENARFKSPLELEMMRRVKAAFDPQGLMNPGKLL